LICNMGAVFSGVAFASGDLALVPAGLVAVTS